MISCSVLSVSTCEASLELTVPLRALTRMFLRAQSTHAQIFAAAHTHVPYLSVQSRFTATDHSRAHHYVYQHECRECRRTTLRQRSGEPTSRSRSHPARSHAAPAPASGRETGEERSRIEVQALPGIRYHANGTRGRIV